MKNLNVEEIKQWIKNYVFNVAHAKGVVLGMSGGKDCLVTAKLCALALGQQNVLGIIMPNGKMKDKSTAIEGCKAVGIRHYIVDINNTYNSIINSISPILEGEKAEMSSVSTINTPPRIRMATLYAIAGSLNYLVVNTSNLSEAMVGYTTKWGDNVGDFSAIANLTKTEVCELGLALGLPAHLVNKAPDDGLSGKTDEENMGITYQELDTYIRTGKKSSNHNKVMHLHNISKHKRTGVVKYNSKLKNHFKKDV